MMGFARLLGCLRMKRHLFLVGVVPIFLSLLISGCALPVPKTKIAYQPATRAIDIQSPKDVSIGTVEVLADGTNFTLRITDYKSESNVEVIRAAASAQAAQIAAGQEALGRVIAAASGAK